MRPIIVAYQWLIGGTLFFVFLMSSFLLTFILPLRLLDVYVKGMLRFIIRVLFIRVKIEGVEHLEPGKSYLFLPNHVSFLDIPLFGGYIPRFLRGVEADRQHKWPVYGWAMKRLGNITIDRSSAQSSMKSLQKAADYIKNDCSIILFPEGGRTSDGSLRPFKKLPFLMAKQAQCDIVPIAMKGMFEVNRKNTLSVTAGTIHLYFGQPITADVIAKMEVTELRDMVREQIEKKLTDKMI